MVNFQNTHTRTSINHNLQWFLDSVKIVHLGSTKIFPQIREAPITDKCHGSKNLLLHTISSSVPDANDNVFFLNQPQNSTLLQMYSTIPRPTDNWSLFFEDSQETKSGRDRGNKERERKCRWVGMNNIRRQASSFLTQFLYKSPIVETAACNIFPITFQWISHFGILPSFE